jgi:hypothetical protein
MKPHQKIMLIALPDNLGAMQLTFVTAGRRLNSAFYIDVTKRLR